MLRFYRNGERITRRQFKILTKYKGIYHHYLVGWMLIEDVDFITERGARLRVCHGAK